MESFFESLNHSFTSKDDMEAHLRTCQRIIEESRPQHLQDDAKSQLLKEFSASKLLKAAPSDQARLVNCKYCFGVFKATNFASHWVTCLEYLSNINNQRMLQQSISKDRQVEENEPHMCKDQAAIEKKLEAYKDKENKRTIRPIDDSVDDVYSYSLLRFYQQKYKKDYNARTFVEMYRSLAILICQKLGLDSDFKHHSYLPAAFMVPISFLEPPEEPLYKNICLNKVIDKKHEPTGKDLRPKKTQRYARINNDEELTFNHRENSSQSSMFNQLTDATSGSFSSRRNVNSIRKASHSFQQLMELVVSLSRVYDPTYDQKYAFKEMFNNSLIDTSQQRLKSNMKAFSKLHSQSDDQVDTFNQFLYMAVSHGLGIAVECFNNEKFKSRYRRIPPTADDYKYKVNIIDDQDDSIDAEEDAIIDEMPIRVGSKRKRTFDQHDGSLARLSTAIDTKHQSQPTNDDDGHEPARKRLRRGHHLPMIASQHQSKREIVSQSLTNVPFPADKLQGQQEQDAVLEPSKVARNLDLDAAQMLTEVIAYGSKAESKLNVPSPRKNEDEIIVSDEEVDDQQQISQQALLHWSSFPFSPFHPKNLWPPSGKHASDLMTSIEHHNGLFDNEPRFMLSFENSPIQFTRSKAKQQQMYNPNLIYKTPPKQPINVASSSSKSFGALANANIKHATEKQD